MYIASKFMHTLTRVLIDIINAFKSETAIDIRQSMLNSNEKLEQSLIDTMAVQSANILFSKSNGVGVRVALSLLLQ